MVGGSLDAKASRPPNLEDLKRLCAALDAAGARYVDGVTVPVAA